MTEITYWVWLSELFARGSDKPNGLLDHFETPKDIFEASADALTATGILTDAEVKRINRHSLERSEYILQECKRLKINIIPKNAKTYPERLRHIFGAPIVLYTYGSLVGLDETPTLAVIGTRHPSEYGAVLTDELCYQLATAGMAIVSGCAVGIDTQAHLGALKAGGRTIAVLGCGLDVNYPPESRELKRQIIRSGGALVTELPPGTAVSGNYFPTRNRIISGLSNGVMVTEAPIRSGALITLNHGLEQGRDVFCVPPHDIHDPIYRGVVKPLRDGAVAVYEVEDVLLEYYGEYSHKLTADKALVDYVRQINTVDSAKTQQKAEKSTEKTKQQGKKTTPKPPAVALNGIAKTVYDLLTDQPQYVSDLAAVAGIPLPQLLSTLTELEIEGLVASYSGQRYGKID